MFCRSVIWFICFLVAIAVATNYSDPESLTTTPGEVLTEETSAEELAALLDAGDGAVVTLVAGDTRLAAHRAVLAARSPVFASVFSRVQLQALGGQVAVSDVEGPVLRHLVAYLYTLRAPRLPGLAPQLLAAADKYGLPGLKAECERQVAAQLSVDTAAAFALLAVRHSATGLRDAAISFIRAHFPHVVATNGWKEAMRNQPDDLVKVTQLLLQPPAETSALAPAAADSGVHHTAQPHSDHGDQSQTMSPSHTHTPDDVASSTQRSLPGEEKGKRLIQATKNGELEEVQSLLASGADVGAKDEVGFTALHWAAYKGHLEIVRRLVEYGASVDARDKWQMTPMVVAAWNGHAAVVRLLAMSFADPNARDVNGRTALHWAALRGYSEAATALLESGADRGARDSKGVTPLDIARQNNRQQLIDALSVPASAEGGPTPGQTPPTQRLGDHSAAASAAATYTTAHSTPPTDGADISPMRSSAAEDSLTTPTSQPRGDHSDQGSTSVAAATPLDGQTTPSSANKSVSILQNLSAFEKAKRLIMAAHDGNVEELKAMIAVGADIGVRVVEDKKTALHWAAARGHAEAVRCLVEAGADIEAQDKENHTALHLAALHGHTDVVRVLLASSADPNVTNLWRMTPLHLAAWEGHAEVAKALLEAGADKAVTDNWGDTPLDNARKHNHQQLIDMLR